MAILATPIQLQKGLQSLFIEALAQEPANLIQQIATYVPSNAKTETYSWLGEVAPLSVFTDEVQFDGLTETSYALTNVKYTGGIEVKRDDLEDEQTGGIAMRIRDLAARAARHANKQLVDALVAGTSELCYDGVEFFSAAHTARGSSGAQSNLVTQTGTSTAQVATDLGSAVAALMNMLDEGGEPLNEMSSQFFVVYPPAINKAMKEAVTAGIVSQTSNVQFSGRSFNLIEQPRLTATDAGDFYVGIADAPVRGLVYQDRSPVTFEAQESGDDAFTREVYRYKVRKRSIAGYGRWQRLVKVA